MKQKRKIAPPRESRVSAAGSGKPGRPPSSGGSPGTQVHTPLRQAAVAACLGGDMPEVSLALFMALLGELGFLRTPRLSDSAVSGVIREHLKALIARRLLPSLTTMKPCKLEVWYDIGAITAAHPVLYERSMCDQTLKLLETHPWPGFMAPYQRVLLDYPASGSDAILTSCRVVVWVPDETDVAEVQSTLRQRANTWGRSVPALKLTTMEAPGINAAVDWLVSESKKPCHLVVSGGERRLRSLDDALPGVLALRMVEILSQRDLSRIVIGVGAPAQAIVRVMRTGVVNWARGRPELGNVLPPDFDERPLWDSIWRQVSDEFSVLRTDSPIRAPRFAVTRSKGARPPRPRVKSRMSKREAPPPK